MVHHFIDMEKFISKNYLMKRDKVDEFLDNNPEQQTLRQQVMEISQKYRDLEKEYKEQRQRWQPSEADNSS